MHPAAPATVRVSPLEEALAHLADRLDRIGRADELGDRVRRSCERLDVLTNAVEV